MVGIEEVARIEEVAGIGERVLIGVQGLKEGFYSQHNNTDKDGRPRVLCPFPAFSVFRGHFALT